MRIVYLHQYFNTPDMPGGTRSFEMAKRWVAAGHDVQVVTSSREAAARGQWKITESAGITIHWRGVPYSNSMGYVSRIRAFIAFMLFAAPRARRLKANVVFATSTPLTIIVPAIWATMLRKTPIVFEVRDLWPTMPIAAGYLKNPVIRRLAIALEWVAYKRSAKIVALSDDMADGVVRAGASRENVVVATNACDVEEFTVPERVGALYRQNMLWLRDRPLIVYCGTIGKLNHVQYLVNLAGHLKEIDPEPVIGIYGAGADHEAVRALAADNRTLGENVFLLGRIPKVEIPAVLSAATLVTSVFLPIPEMQANSANKFFDGLAAGRPIAINYEGWQATLLRGSGAGVVLDSRDPALGAKQVYDFLSDNRALAAARTAASALATEEFARDTISRRVLNTIEEAAAAS